jgi:hypothetical protein
VNRRGRKIILYPRGGLGNQLFQYGAALQLSKSLELPIAINEVLLGSSIKLNNGVGHRLLEINQFENSVMEIYSPGKLKSEVLSTTLTVERMLGDRVPKFLLKFGVFANEQQDQINVFKTIEKAVSINSYCSSPAYFSECQDELAQQISQIRNPSEWYLKSVKELEEVSPIALHIRLGDYKNLSSVYGRPDPEYYANAVNLITERIGERPIWLFSDEPELANEIVESRINISRIIDHNVSDRAIEHLNLLGKCRGIACANSSFSWWSGFLSSKLVQGSTVVFPRPMFDSPNLKEPHNWLPGDWLTLGRQIGL